MNNSPDTTPGIVSVLSISPTEEDHLVLRDILNLLDATFDPHCTFLLKSCINFSAALSVLRDRPSEVVVCERDLQPGSWKDVLEHLTILPDPPSLVVTSRHADERLWAEALNLGAFDVLAKPFDRTEALRVIGAAWRAWGRPARVSAREGRHTYKVAAAGSVPRSWPALQPEPAGDRGQENEHGDQTECEPTPAAGSCP
jgi:DNA-binding NarL/FixJ family response regulator